MSGDQHPFVVWLVKHHVKADNPVGDLARDVQAGLDLPASGDGATLRHHLDYNGCGEWALAAFDVAWQQYQPTCEWPGGVGCTQPALDAMSYCGEHALTELL